MMCSVRGPLRRSRPGLALVRRVLGEDVCFDCPFADIRFADVRVGDLNEGTDFLFVIHSYVILTLNIYVE
jgi:hypothetical protein